VKFTSYARAKWKHWIPADTGAVCNANRGLLAVSSFDNARTIRIQSAVASALRIVHISAIHAHSGALEYRDNRIESSRCPFRHFPTINGTYRMHHRIIVNDNDTTRRGRSLCTRDTPTPTKQVSRLFAHEPSCLESNFRLRFPSKVVVPRSPFPSRTFEPRTQEGERRRSRDKARPQSDSNRTSVTAPLRREMTAGFQRD